MDRRPMSAVEIVGRVGSFRQDSRSGYSIRASIDYDVTFRALLGGTWLGPYPMGSVTLPATPLDYPVRQAQPELVAIGQ